MSGAACASYWSYARGRQREHPLPPVRLEGLTCSRVVRSEASLEGSGLGAIQQSRAVSPPVSEDSAGCSQPSQVPLAARGREVIVTHPAASGTGVEYPIVSRIDRHVVDG